MRSLSLLLITALTATMAHGQDDAAAPELKTTKDKVSYAIGLNIGRQFQEQGMKLDPAVVARGIATVLNDEKELLTEEQMQAAFTAFRAEMAKEKEQQNAANKVEGDTFLLENAAKKGVVKTKSGLQYLVLRKGTGETPSKEDRVSTHYRGKLLSGKVFDESYKGEVPVNAEMPVSFGVTQVIAGWTEALQLMKVGAKYRLFIPSDLAYGAPGRPGIPPNSVLIFEIELVSIPK